MTEKGVAERGDCAHSSFYHRRTPNASRPPLGVLAHRHDAEDVCQDAFVKALERLEDCREPSRFVQWLLTITRNRALSYRSYRQVRETSELLPEIAVAPDSPSAEAVGDLPLTDDALLSTSTRKEIDAVLTADQRQKLDSVRPRGRRGGRGGRGGFGPPGTREPRGAQAPAEVKRP